MPKVLEEKLKKEAEKKFPKDEERQGAYVYGNPVMQKFLKNKRKK